MASGTELRGRCGRVPAAVCLAVPIDGPARRRGQTGLPPSRAWQRRRRPGGRAAAPPVSVSAAAPRRAAFAAAAVSGPRPCPAGATSRESGGRGAARGRGEARTRSGAVGPGPPAQARSVSSPARPGPARRREQRLGDAGSDSATRLRAVVAPAKAAKRGWAASESGPGGEPARRSERPNLRTLRRVPRRANAAIAQAWVDALRLAGLGPIRARRGRRGPEPWVPPGRRRRDLKVANRRRQRGCSQPTGWTPASQ